MKKATFFLLMIFLLMLNSCVVTENVNFNADNSGKISYKFDMSKVMQMMGNSMKLEGKKVTKDIDSTFTFASLYESKKDSIAKLSKEEQAKIKKMEKFTCHMLMKEKEGIFVYDMYADFKNTEDLQEMTSPVNTLSELSPSGKNAVADVAPKNKGVTRYAFNGKKFSKMVVANKEEEKHLKMKVKKEGDKEEEVVGNSMSQSTDMLMEESSYDMIVTFPKKVKKVSAANAKISEDKKTVTISYPMKEYMESKNLNFEVELE